jgi:phage replication-related protein YjqB (UPF0714/DUF867 family)
VRGLDWNLWAAVATVVSGGVTLVFALFAGPFGIAYVVDRIRFRKKSKAVEKYLREQKANRTDVDDQGQRTALNIRLHVENLDLTEGKIQKIGRSNPRIQRRVRANKDGFADVELYEYMGNVDKYGSYEELLQNEQEDHFEIRHQERSSGVVVIAPHGGGIEPGTSEIAEGVAGTEHTFYAFEGLMPSGNRELHITSTNFDEPIGLEIAQKAQQVVTIHGCAKKEEVVHLGGLDSDLKNKIKACLTTKEFRVKESQILAVQGASRDNICNRSKNGRGVQIEVSMGLRQRMFESLKRQERRHSTPTYDRFVSALKQAITSR